MRLATSHTREHPGHVLEIHSRACLPSGEDASIPVPYGYPAAYTNCARREVAQGEQALKSNELTWFPLPNAVLRMSCGGDPTPLLDVMRVPPADNLPYYTSNSSL